MLHITFGLLSSTHIVYASLYTYILHITFGLLSSTHRISSTCRLDPSHFQQMSNSATRFPSHLKNFSSEFEDPKRILRAFHPCCFYSIRIGCFYLDEPFWGKDFLYSSSFYHFSVGDSLEGPPHFPHHSNLGISPL